MSKRVTVRQSVLAACACLMAGCSAVRLARETQRETSANGSGAVAVNVSRFDLHGYSLERLVAFALTNRPSVVSARLAVEDARLALRAIAADAPIVSETPWTAPQVSARAGYAESSRGTAATGGDWRTYGDPSAGVSLDLLIWDFGRNDARARAQAERVVAAEQALVDEGFAVFDDVSQTYFTFLERSALLEVALKQEFEYAEHLRLARARQAEGEAQKLDVLRARLDLAQASELVVSASNLVMTSGAALMGALGVDVSRGTYEEVLDPPRAELDAVVRGFDRSSFDVNEAFAFARTNAPAMRIVRAKLRAASADVDYAVADLWPTLTASLDLSWTNPLWVWGWGVNAVQSVFEGFRRTTAVDRSVVALRSAAAEVDRTEQELSLALEVAVADRDNAVKALATAKASVASARENLEVVKQQLAVGTVSRIDLSEAVSSLSVAMGSVVSAYYGGQVVEAKLFRTMGRAPAYHEGVVHQNTGVKGRKRPPKK